jgi:hypothetical protein
MRFCEAEPVVTAKMLSDHVSTGRDTQRITPTTPRRELARSVSASPTAGRKCRTLPGALRNRPATSSMPPLERDGIKLNHHRALGFLFEHDLFGKPPHTFPDHALADGLGAGLQLAEDLQGARVIGRCYSGWHSTKGRDEMLVGFRHAILFQQ